ncbi:MAG: WD40 repeat domain-containing protein, partial [Candidatus Krumholzibacteriota bacterium]|nr:WD40 repeat domain-containing protein [Candidatus Krumholzibacteriota bacterium]
MRRSTIILFSLMMLITGGASGAPGEWETFLNSSAITRIINRGDSLWCATNGGILLYDLGDSTFIQYYNGLDLKSSYVTDIVFDPHGSLWISYTGAGITRIENWEDNPISRHHDAIYDLMLSDSVTCLASVEEDIYYGSLNGMAKFYENKHALEPQLSDSLYRHRVYDIWYDPDGNLLWIAFSGGIARFNRDTYAYTRYALGEVYAVCAHGGEIYCAGENGVQLWDGDSWAPFGAGLAAAPVAISSGGGELYCATPNRAYRWNGVFWAGVDATGLKLIYQNEYRILWQFDTIRSLVVDGRGTPWVGCVLEKGRRGSYLTGFV